MIYPVDSAIQRLNNQGLMSKVKKRAWKCIEIKVTGTLYTELWCSPCVWLPYTAFPLSHKIKDSQVDFHVHSSIYISILADFGQFKWPVDFSITLTMTLLEGRSVTSKVYWSPSSATPFLLNSSFLTLVPLFALFPNQGAKSHNFHTITGEWPTNLRCHIIFHTVVTATVLKNRHEC